MMKNKYELLAPAGNMSSLEAAVIAGADAVYLGASEFSARAKAKNFNIEELMEAITYAHLRNVKIFVTMNILIADTEFEEALKLAQKLYDIGVDALIVQDFGLVKEIKKLLPDFELHASTQMAINNYYGALFLKDMGFSRIVLARETPIFEIKKIKELNIHRPLEGMSDTSSYPEVNENQKVEGIYHLLAQTDAVIVNDSNNQNQYLLKREDIFNYLAERKENVTHA